MIQNAFESEKTHEYPKSFSCGMVEVPKDHEELDIVKIIEEADAVMYLQKKNIGRASRSCREKNRKKDLRENGAYRNAVFPEIF